MRPLSQVLEYLKLYDENLPVGDRMLGKDVTVINRSEIVGRPLAGLPSPVRAPLNPKP